MSTTFDTTQSQQDASNNQEDEKPVKMNLRQPARLLKIHVVSDPPASYRFVVKGKFDVKYGFKIFAGPMGWHHFDATGLQLRPLGNGDYEFVMDSHGGQYVHHYIVLKMTNFNDESYEISHGTHYHIDEEKWIFENV